MPEKTQRIIASIEARMGSSRLPGKVLKDIAGKPALTRLIERLRGCCYLTDIVLATTTNVIDDALAVWAGEEKVKIYRGSEDDVLGRVVAAHEAMQTDIIVEVTGDCILLDPDMIDMGIETFLKNDCDVVTNVKYSSYPMGMDIQIFNFSQLAWVEKNIIDPAVREHVSLYFYENPSQYRIFHLIAPRCWQKPHYRFQLDYQEDWQFIDAIFRELEPRHGSLFGMQPIMQLLEMRPQLVAMNEHCLEKAAR